MNRSKYYVYDMYMRKVGFEKHAWHVYDVSH